MSDGRRAVLLEFDEHEIRDLIHADALTETCDLAEFARRATLDKVGLVLRLAQHGRVSTTCCNGTGLADYAAVPCPDPACPVAVGWA